MGKKNKHQKKSLSLDERWGAVKDEVLWSVTLTDFGTQFFTNKELGQSYALAWKVPLQSYSVFCPDALVHKIMGNIPAAKKAPKGKRLEAYIAGASFGQDKRLGNDIGYGTILTLGDSIVEYGGSLQDKNRLYNGVIAELMGAIVSIKAAIRKGYATLRIYYHSPAVIDALPPENTQNQHWAMKQYREFLACVHSQITVDFRPLNQEEPSLIASQATLLAHTLARKVKNTRTKLEFSLIQQEKDFSLFSSLYPGLRGAFKEVDNLLSSQRVQQWYQIIFSPAFKQRYNLTEEEATITWALLCQMPNNVLASMLHRNKRRLKTMKNEVLHKLGLRCALGDTGLLVRRLVAILDAFSAVPFIIEKPNF